MSNQPPLSGGGLVLPGGVQQVQVQNIKIEVPGLKMEMQLPIPVTAEQQQLDAIAKVLINMLIIMAHDRADRKAITVQVQEAAAQMSEVDKIANINRARAVKHGKHP